MSDSVRNWLFGLACGLVIAFAFLGPANAHDAWHQRANDGTPVAQWDGQWIVDGGYVDPDSGVRCCDKDDCERVLADDYKLNADGTYEVRITCAGITKIINVPRRKLYPTEENGEFWICVRRDSSFYIYCAFDPRGGS